ncbi:MAG: galactose mutarotase [Oscillospiraceae bacterium]|jgi:aldose 1-epimerase|nr:galactose mutarotase [Oscillospiraceae bacterium]
MTQQHYARHPGGRDVAAYTLDNGQIKATILTYGATLDALYAPDRAGKRENILMTFQSLEDRMAHSAYQGETVGRYCNRIAGAAFTLDGREHRVTSHPEGSYCLHGNGEFSHAVWDTEEATDDFVALTYLSPAGSEGFPGTIRARACYRLAGGALTVTYTAISDENTVIGMTNHAYFNLTGNFATEVLSHELMLNAGYYLPISADTLIPTGEIAPVAGTAFDFRAARPIAREYDHNFCLTGVGPAARVYEPQSGRLLEIGTNQPGVQLYTGNSLARKHTGFCLETQPWPDSPNRAWPGSSGLLRAGEEYRAETTFAFSAR